MKLIKKALADIHPYPKNPRKNDHAVEAVAESIRQCGYVAPIIVDEAGEILAGHTRYKALKELGETEAEVVVKEGLTEEQKKKYRLLDNKTGEIAGWDFSLQEEELLAFCGTMSASQMIAMGLTQAALKVLYEIVIFPATSAVCKKIKIAEEVDEFAKSRLHLAA